MRAKRFWTEDEKARLTELRAKGCSPANIAHRLNRSPGDSGNPHASRFLECAHGVALRLQDAGASMNRVEHLAEGVTLYLGDCREILPSLPRVDAVVTDPPYGQRQNTNVRGAGGLRACTPPGCGSRAIANVQRARKAAGGLHSTGIAVEHPEGIAGDDAPFDPAPWLVFAPELLIWGAHKFADRLPSGGWLLWDKVPTGKIRDQGDGEAAWINKDQPLRIFRLLWDGVCVGSAARHEVTAGQQRHHPTQKPEALMTWCLSFIEGRTILDPYMGSGSTGVAAVKLKRQFIGIEIEPKYFDIACRRISEALKQPDLFIEKPKPAKQELLEL